MESLGAGARLFGLDAMPASLHTAQGGISDVAVDDNCRPRWALRLVPAPPPAALVGTGVGSRRAVNVLSWRAGVACPVSRENELLGAAKE
jgi:hypothetical protein